MRFSSWRETAELLTLLAVVGGLIAVVVELRQTQAALTAQAYQARAFDVIETQRLLLGDEELRALLSQINTQVQTGELDLQSMDASGRSAIFEWFYIIRTDLDNEHYLYEQGYLDTDFYQTTTEPEIKAHAPYWRQLGIPEPRQSFTAEVDRILSDPAIP